MRTCIFLCVNVYLMHNYSEYKIMLNLTVLRISVIKMFLACIYAAVLTIFGLFKSLVWMNGLFIKSLYLAEKGLDHLADQPLIRSIFKYKFIQAFAVFVLLSAMVFGFLIKVSDALVIESQGRIIAEQKFEAQVNQDTPDDIFLSKKERLNE